VTAVTKQGAVDTARGMVDRFGKSMVVYRLDAWPADVYGVIAQDRGLPPEARVFATIAPEGVTPIKGQGVLF
jgi:hypothetical protein